MAFTLPNWFAAPQLETPDFLGEYMKGYRASQEPAAMRRKAEEERIANALKGLELQYAPQQYEQEATARGQGIEARGNELNDQPEMLTLALEEARRGNMLGGKYDEQKILAALQQQKAAAETQRAHADYYRNQNSSDKVSRQQALANSLSWRNTPLNAKNQEIAIFQGAGGNSAAYIDGRIRGLSPEEIAVENGIDPELLRTSTPVNVPTTPAITREIRKNQALAELDVLDKHASEAMAPYSQRLFGLSPALIADALQGESKDKIAKFAAARALQAELAALRINAAGGNIGHGAIQDIVHSALGKSDLPEWLITPEIYGKMGEFIDKWLKEGAQASTKALYRGNSQVTSNLKPVEKMTLDEINEELPNG
jgi:hypothetical protein